ncbi:MAG: helix-turn-helix domain-containing protein [Solirubrobacteraceae bacterium]|jgi:cytoskeleton protein RodZ
MPDIGATLREARTRARIDISEVEVATKIRAKYLRAIENEEWELLPGPTFVKSFLRTYADYLGVDGRLLVEEYKLRHEPPVEHEIQPLAPNRGDERPRRIRPPAISRGWAIGLSIVGLIALLIVLGSISERQSATLSTPTPPKASRRPAHVAAKPHRVSLQLIPSDSVYVCLRNSKDELLLSNTIEPGSDQKTYRSKRFRLTLGNSSLQMKVNGRTLGVPSSANAINYELTPAGRKRLSDSDNAC